MPTWVIWSAYFLPEDPQQRLLPHVTGANARAYVGGKEALRYMRADLAKATGSSDFIYVANWWCDVDFPIVDGDPSSTLSTMLSNAASAGVQVRAMLWASLDPPAAPIDWLSALFPLGYAEYEAARWLFKKIIDLYTSNRAYNTKATTFINSLAPRGDTWAILDNRHRIFGSHHQKLLVLGIQGRIVAHLGGVEFNADRLHSIPNHPGTPLFDTSVRLEGNAAWLALRTFVERWQAHPDTQSKKRPALRGPLSPLRPHLGARLLSR